MTSTTERIRAMLDERGVEWHDTKIGKGFITVYEHDGITWIVTEHSSGRLSVKGCVKPTQGHYDGMTPEQAIAATLGTGTCKRVMDSIDPFAMWVCDHCGHPLDTSENFCGGCGRKVIEPTTNDVDAEVEQ